MEFYRRRRPGHHKAQAGHEPAPEMDKIVAQGLADAKTLKVKATPEFFVNGRPLPSFGFDQLKAW